MSAKSSTAALTTTPKSPCYTSAANTASWRIRGPKSIRLLPNNQIEMRPNLAHRTAPLVALPGTLSPIPYASHIRLRIPSVAQKCVQRLHDRRIVPMIFRINAKDRKTRRQRAKEFIVVQLLNRSVGRIEDEILSPRGTAAARPVVVPGNVDAQ